MNGRDAAGDAEMVFGRHATMTYQDVVESGEPTNSVQQANAPRIYRGERNVKVRVIPANGSDVRLEEVYLKRVSLDGSCPQVYRRVKEKKTSYKKAHYDGLVLQALRMERVDGYTDLFREPEDIASHMVAIKKQSLNTIQFFVGRGHHENPYNAIAAMQAIGDDIHVLDCIEALQDKKNLYTIMKYCDGGIMSMLLDDDDDYFHKVPETTARTSITKVWKNLHYLQEHGFVHHDLSPDNILFLQGNLVFTDLAMSLKIPGDPNSRRLLKAQGRYGKDAYLSPEVYVSHTLPVPFDGFGLDLWATACILYNLLTGHFLFHKPFPEDVLFKYFVMAKGLSNSPLNTRTIEITIDVFQSDHHLLDRQPLLTRAMANIQLSPTATHLLQHMLDMNPANRFTLAECMQSSWARGEAYLWLDPLDVRHRDR
jgi:serine/threonine protein kinase